MSNQAPAKPIPPPPLFGEPLDWLWSCILMAGIILVYQPIWHAGFFWDDKPLIITNACIVGPLGLGDIWTTRAADICPLTLTTFWMEYTLWGLRSSAYHIVDIILHVGCALTLWQLLRLLKVPGAWLCAAIWALHPIQVESVAWISETKNTQSGLFFLLSIFFFVSYLTGRPGWNYTFTLFFAALAMASKTSTVVLPMVLLLCAWWLKDESPMRTLIKVVPVFLMSAAAAWLSFWTQSQELADAVGPVSTESWAERLIIAGCAIWFYLGKLIWPHPLMIIYPRWTIDSGNFAAYLPLVAAIALLVIFWIKRESWGRGWFFGFGYFLVSLIPVLGFFNNVIFSYSFVFDHLIYLPSIGPLVMAGAGITLLMDRLVPEKGSIPAAPGAALILTLALVSWNRAGVYQSEDALWTDTLAKNPGCWAACDNLGRGDMEKGDVDEAIDQFQKALVIDPGLPKVHNNLGVAFLSKEQLNNAIEQFQKALAINPNFTNAHYNLGLALTHAEKYADAAKQFEDVLRLRPDDDLAQKNLEIAKRAADTP